MLLNKENKWVTENGVNLQHLFPISDNRNFAPFGSAWAKVQPGEATTLHTHRVAEVFFITSGSGYFNIEGEEQSIKEGDVIYVAPDKAHTICNLDSSQEELSFLSVWWEANERIIKHLNMYLLPAYSGGE
ncbi:mannose-6-phosphate isomerase-like protein (cupin superfamily) [Paenibacillus sp. DS2015]|uniref:cupin domain-containing protein n=1 Tax=Paenibacillus sp. DS2015 TaxID=3373917 RepID=UPI003D25306A